MPKICYEIEVDTDTDEVMAGICPDDQSDADKPHLSPVESIDAALEQARAALKAPGDDEPNESEEDRAMAAMREGYEGPTRRAIR